MSRAGLVDRFRLPKGEIIKSASEIGEVLRKGRKYSGRHISFFCELNSPPAAGNKIRVAFTVSKKVGRAVDRNRVKRLMREVYRLNRERTVSIVGKDGKGSSLVISCSRGIPAATLSLRDIEEDFEQFLRRVSGDIAG